MASKTLPKLPVIDLSLREDLRPGTRAWESMCKEVCNALEEYKESGTNENYLGLLGHTDKSFSTVIHQDGVNGLEIQTRDEQWILYDPPSHSSFIYLASDAFKVGLISLVRFIRTVMGVPDELVDEEHPLRYKPFNHREYRKLHIEYGSKKIEYSIEAHCGV
ncbi:probable inactive 2-oxoglutarate-dependent dioxygenase AOP2 [Pistacia vera]|uniref:probable inactive 2-oxoglutarate-dependent dioxygenase AOP2 n=1 Tax=Pistacia vera TaxID=55513 RepID=UPI0012639410|nr:probable inactive 2-oxoglutarate-dependent dioxygenase AOP2 [Pistacia vera]